MHVGEHCYDWVWRGGAAGKTLGQWSGACWLQMSMSIPLSYRNKI